MKRKTKKSISILSLVAGLLVPAIGTFSSANAQGILEIPAIDRVTQSSSEQTISIPMILSQSFSANVFSGTLNEYFNTPNNTTDRSGLDFVGFSFANTPQEDCISSSNIRTQTDYYDDQPDREATLFDISLCNNNLDASTVFGYINYAVRANAPIGNYTVSLDFSKFSTFDPNIGVVDIELPYSIPMTVSVTGTVEPQAEVIGGPFDYTGEAIKPKVNVTADDHGRQVYLSEYQDYVLSYGENILAGENAGSITISPSTDGLYNFEPLTINFPIIEEEPDDEEISVQISEDATTGEISFRINKDFLFFTNGGEVYVDGSLLGVNDFIAESGSTIITLTPDFINTLSTGEHLLAVVFGDGTRANANFMVSDGADSDGDDVVLDGDEALIVPNTGSFTGEVSGVSVAGMSIAGAVLIICLAILRKIRR